MMAAAQTLVFDERLYDAQTLQKSAYRGMNFITVEISSSNGSYSCVLTPNIGIEEERFLSAVQEFKKDVVDYQLRRQLEIETKAVKNLILGLAFSKTGMISE